jgi:hypothetical protein
LAVAADVAHRLKVLADLGAGDAPNSQVQHGSDGRSLGRFRLQLAIPSEPVAVFDEPVDAPTLGADEAAAGQGWNRTSASYDGCR